MLADWADTLEDWEHRQVVWALRKWRNENPNKKPNPGHILAVLKEQRGRAMAERAKQQPVEPEPFSAPITDEERERRAAVANEVMKNFRSSEK